MRKKTLLSMLCASASLVALSGADFTNAVIVHPDKIDSLERQAVSDLQSYLGRAVGRKFAVLPESRFKGGTSIQVGHTAAAKKALPGLDKLEKQSWRIKDAGNTLFLAGGSPSGANFAVFDFLNRNGIYALTPDCDAVPKLGKLEIAGWDITGKMPFQVREIYHGLYYPMLWKTETRNGIMSHYERRNFGRVRRADQTDAFRMSWRPGTSHTFYNYLPPAKYAKTHPEYYSMNKQGKREWNVYNQLCFSNPEVRRLVKEQLFRFIEQDRAKKAEIYPTLYDFSQMDASSWYCFCKPCQAIIKKYGSDTGLMLFAVNELAEEARKKYPDVHIQTFAYVNTEVPLETIKPAKNVVMKYCDLYSKSNCFMPLRKQPEQLKLLEGWAARTSNLFLWDYWNMGGNGASAPGMIIDAVIDDIRLFRDKKVGGLFLEAEIDGCRPQSFIWLQYFLGYQLMKDPDADAEKLIAVFIDNYYGKAAPQVRKYFDFLRETIRKSANSDYEQSSRLKILSDVNFLKKSHDMLLPALKAAGNDAASKRRVLDELNVVDYAFINVLKIHPLKGVDRDKIIADYRKNMLFTTSTNILASKAAVAKFAKDIENEVAVFNVNYALPPELAKRPAPDIHRLAYPQFPWGYQDAKRLKDPASDMLLSLVYLPEDQSKHRSPFPIGLYDRTTKRSLGCRITPVSTDEKYHWYKLGRFKIGRDTIIWGSGAWAMSIYLKEYYVNDDGVSDSENPNVYDVWVSARFSGPAYNQGSKSRNGAYIDKAVLARPGK